MPDISRRQAWMKLAVLIADGLPDPHEIRFHADGDGITVLFDSDTPMRAWMEPLGIASLDRPITSRDGDRWIHGGSTFGWHGWYVRISATTPVDPAEEIADDVGKVRELADAPPEDPAT